jgi:ABC-type phosphate/phosphonate transport system permease subunit
MSRLAAAIALLGMVVAFVIGIGIALVVLDARESNDIVGFWLDVARWLTEPFRGIFDLERGKEHLQIAINWGIAALVYLLIATVIARLLRSAGGGGRSFMRRRRATSH